MTLSAALVLQANESSNEVATVVTMRPVPNDLQAFHGIDGLRVPNPPVRTNAMHPL
jgi:hypothetical protein